VIGKGITRFHAVYWPARLLSAGVPLPTTIFIHGYITLGGEKISKSSGNIGAAIRPGRRSNPVACCFQSLSLCLPMGKPSRLISFLMERCGVPANGVSLGNN
jgi:hypothetical protein